MADAPAPVLAAVAIGSNVGDRQLYLDRALNLVDRVAGVRVIATAGVYESAGWGREGLRSFLNSAFAVEVDPAMAAVDFLAALLRIEDRLGRQRTLKWGPRTLDLDLLAFGDVVSQREDLALPHPWIAHRPFVYRPLAELAAICPAWEVLARANAEGTAIEADTVRLAGQPPCWGVGLRTGRATVMTASEDETVELGRAIGRTLAGGETILLNAPMGSGKTMLARGIARGLGIEGRIQSPSFTLCRQYTAPGGLTLEHWDFYRLGNEDDLASTGFDPMRRDDRILLIEWAGAFPAAAGPAWAEIQLAIEPDERRRISLLPGAAGGRLPFVLGAIGR